MNVLKPILLFPIVVLQSLHSSELIKIENDELEVTISSLGGELQSMVKKDTLREYLWHGDPEFWDGRAPIMFPVAVRHKDHKFEHNGISYNMPLLGIVHTRKMEIVAQSPDSVTLQLESDRRTRESFPFDFRFAVTYKLAGNKLTQTHCIENTGEDTFYYATGGHPGFVIPGKRSDYKLTFSETLNGSIPIITEGLIQDKLIPFFKQDRTLGFGDSKFPSHGILLIETPSREIGIAQSGNHPFLKVNLGDFPNVNIWSPPGKPFVCIEPQISHHDVQDSPRNLADKKHLIPIPTDNKHSYTFSIIVK